ncbi:unnamed protein product [Bathycoccus prasinos]
MDRDDDANDDEPQTPSSALFNFKKSAARRGRTPTPLAPPPTLSPMFKEEKRRVFFAPSSSDEEEEEADDVDDFSSESSSLILSSAQKTIEQQQRDRLNLLRARLQNAQSKAEKQRKAREQVATKKKIKRANERAVAMERDVTLLTEKREKEEVTMEKESERLEKVRAMEREEMGKSERLQRELDETARARREREAEVVKAEARYERTMRETAQGERVVSMNERVIFEREERVENMMETERKLREKTETLEKRTAQARKDTEVMKEENEVRAMEIEKQRKENAKLRERWALTVKTCEKTDEEARRLFEETSAVKREEAKVRLEIGAEFKEIALAKKDIKAFDSEKEKLLLDIKKNEDLISACSITSEQHAKDTDEDRKETDGLVATAATLRLRASEVSREIDRVNEEREKLREKQHALEDEIVSKLSNEIAARTERAKFDSKSIERLKKQTRDIESATVRYENLKAMADVDKLDFESEMLDTDREIEESEIEIQNMALETEAKEVKIKNGRRELEKLAMERDALDKRAERINDRILAAERVKASSNNSTNESTGGPLDATLASLKKELAATRNKSNQSRQNWLNAQNELLTLAEGQKKSASLLQELLSDERLYEGKKNRHERDAKVYERDALAINREIDRLRRQLSMLNEEVSLSEQILASAPEEFKVLKQTLQTTLDDAKRELKSAENNLACEERDVEKEKARIDALREEVSKWNRERKMEIETQNKLDPNVGNVELLRAREEVHALEKQLDKAKRSKETMAVNLETRLKKREILASSANDLVFVVDNAARDTLQSNDDGETDNDIKAARKNKSNRRYADESYAIINSVDFEDKVLYEDPNDDDVAYEIKRKRNEDIHANRRRKQEKIAQREIREALKTAAVSNENAELLERKAKELKASCDAARASAKMAMHETQRLKIETGAAQRRAEAHVIDTARSQRARKMLEAAADKIRYEVVEENDEDESEKCLENNRYRISEYDNQSLTNEQSASDKLREVESERERLSRLLRHAWEQEEEEEDDDEDDETRSDDDEDEKLRRAINRAQHLLESRHQISFAASYVHDAIDKQKAKFKA